MKPYAFYCAVSLSIIGYQGRYMYAMTSDALRTQIRTLIQRNMFEQAGRLLKEDTQKGARALLSADERDLLLFQTLTPLRAQERAAYEAEIVFAKQRAQAKTWFENLAQQIPIASATQQSVDELITFLDYLYQKFPRASDLRSLSEAITTTIDTIQKQQRSAQLQKNRLNEEQKLIQQEITRINAQFLDTLHADVAAYAWERLEGSRLTTQKLQEIKHYFGVDLGSDPYQYKARIASISDIEQLKKLQIYLRDLPLIEDVKKREEEKKEKDSHPQEPIEPTKELQETKELDIIDDKTLTKPKKPTYQPPSETQEPHTKPPSTPQEIKEQQDIPAVIVDKASEQQKSLYEQQLKTLLQTAGIAPDNLAQGLHDIATTLDLAYRLLGTNNAPHFKQAQANIEHEIENAQKVAQNYRTQIQNRTNDLNTMHQNYIELLIDAIVIHTQTAFEKVQKIITSSKTSLSNISFSPNNPDQQRNSLVTAIEQLPKNEDKVQVLQTILNNILSSKGAGKI